jgi:hypothetical protein
MAERLSVGDVVLFPLAGRLAKGSVREVYGTPPRLMVVINMTPELTGEYVDEPTTVVWPIADVQLARNAA